MKNPCKLCVVKIMCGEICPSKESYKEQVNDALSNLAEEYKDYYAEIPMKIKDKLLLYHKRVAKNYDEMRMIRERKNT